MLTNSYSASSPRQGNLFGVGSFICANGTAFHPLEDLPVLSDFDDPDSASIVPGALAKLGGLGLLDASGVNVLGHMNNMPPSKRQNQSAALEAGGFDWLDASVYGQWKSHRWQVTKGLLQSGRDNAASGGSGMVAIGNEPVRVFPHGSGSRGVYCCWGLEWHGIEVWIVDAPGSVQDRPSVFVHCGAEVLMAWGARRAWGRAMVLLRRLGFQYDRSKWSRFDLCADLAGRTVQEFVEPFVGGRVVKRARKWTVRGDGKDCTGVEVGASAVRLRIYDKVREVYVDRPDPVKAGMMEELRWGGHPKSAVRVEFQCRRDLVRAAEMTNAGGELVALDSVEDLFRNVGAVAEWLTLGWVRWCDDVDRANRHADRAGPSDLWRAVRNSFNSVCRGLVTGGSWHRKPRRGDGDQLEAQARGCFASLFALRGVIPRRTEDVIREFIVMADRWGEAFLCDVVGRRAEMETHGPGVSLVEGLRLGGGREIAFDEFMGDGERGKEGEVF